MNNIRIPDPQEGDECPHCIFLQESETIEFEGESGKLEIVKGDNIYDIDHLACGRCDSTYCL